MITYYYPRTLKGITVALLNLFNDLKVVKYDANGDPVDERTVPITFGPVEKYHQDRIENHYVDKDGKEHGQNYYLQLPRLALVLNGIVYDSDRAAGVNQWRYWFKESLELTDSEVDQIISDYQPTPYNYNFTLDIRCDGMDNLSQILENILPYFNPKLMLRVKEFSFLNIERDLPVVMDGVNPDFIQDQNENDSRYVNATIGITVEGWMYRKFVTSKVITNINSKYFLHSTGSFLEGFSTSAHETSAGVLVETSGLPLSGDYFTSGAYDTDNKEFIWYKEYHTSGTSASY
jgi:hypothetical protein